jgi:hypothetical protein
VASGTPSRAGQRAPLGTAFHVHVRAAAGTKNIFDAAILWPNNKYYLFQGSQWISWDIATAKVRCLEHLGVSLLLPVGCSRCLRCWLAMPPDHTLHPG